MPRYPGIKRNFVATIDLHLESAENRRLREIASARHVPLTEAAREAINHYYLSLLSSKVIALDVAPIDQERAQ